MRRRTWIATGVIAALLLAIALFKLRASHQRDVLQAQHGEHASTHEARTRARGASAATRNVAGTVYLEDATVSGAAVRIVALRSVYQATKQTDARGHFDFGPVPVGEYRVIAELPHATGAALRVDLRDRLLDAEKLRLIAHACDASLHGVVRDASGGVIRRARLFVAEFFDEGPGADAGDDGAYELCVPVGDSGVIVRADGYADVFAPVSAFGRVRRDFELVPEVVVGGRAVRASDDTPVAGARLTLRAVDFSSMQRVPTVHAFSDADGQFRFRGVASGQFLLTATADHLASAEAMHVDADVATPAEELTCKLVATLSVTGIVIEKTSKKPVPGHELFAVAENMESGSKRATSGADGAFVLENLAPGSYRISDARLARAGEPTGIQVRLDKADVDGLKIEVDALGSIAGRITRAGKPIDGASLQPRRLDSNDRFERPPAAAISDADGRFVLRGVAAGKYQLYAESKRVGAFTSGPIVNVAAGENKAGVDIELELAGSIAGTVVDQRGAAVSGVHLRFSLTQGRDFGEATTADDGTFKAAALSGGGDYMFQVYAVPNSRLTLRPADGAQFTPITVRDGNSHVTGVVIKVQFERLSISGRVLAADGSPAADVSVTAERGNKGRGFMGPTATTDTSGKFVIKDLPAGKYAVFARSPSGFAHIEGVVAGAGNVDLRLPALGAIEGTLEGFVTSPSVFALASADDMMMVRLNATVTGKTFSFKRVPVGKYMLMARSKDGVAHADVTVDGKAVAKVVLRNPGSGAIEGRVVDEITRQPIPNLMCESESSRIRSDASGAFRLERVTAGKTFVHCYGNAMQAHASVTVEVGKTARVELAAKKWAQQTFTRGYAGLELAIIANNVAVKKVVSGGPAERAGIKSGDIVREVDDEEVEPMMGPQLVLTGIEDHGAGELVKLTLERDGKQRTVDLKLDARP